MSPRKMYIHFCLGACFGLSLTFLLRVYDWTGTSTHINIRAVQGDFGISTNNSCVHSVKDMDHHIPVREIYTQSLSDVQQHNFNDADHHHDDDSIAKEMFKKVRVLCWIMTSPINLEKKAVHVKNTWAKRCNTVLYMSSVHDPKFPTVGLNVTEGRTHLTAKTMKAFLYVYEHHLADADWFLKADDDTYVILENLRYFLSDEDPEKAVYFGLRFKPFVKQGYTSGGGGYVLSKEALRRFGQEGAKNQRLCAQDLGAEDIKMGECMQNLGVVLKPSADVMRRSRFHCFTPETVLKGRFPSWFKNYDFEAGRGGIENISDYAISFHYIAPDSMYALEFYTYHLRPYGILNKPQKLNVRS
ncbi:unnamed protein product [Lymnaea stagnalis]|uniref:Glycoprotein-N-acetylgalactosamine 3-beta-galactosyltransferase 1 n=1 Tax=Lymnaea stagnalis TaxID=6523 RepID=A0AAV2GZ95_LYMST